MPLPCSHLNEHSTAKHRLHKSNTGCCCNAVSPERSAFWAAALAPYEMSSRAKRSSTESRNLLPSFTVFIQHQSMGLNPRHVFVFVARLDSTNLNVCMLLPSEAFFNGAEEPASVFYGLHPPQNDGCPILVTSLFLWLGWDSTNLNVCYVILSEAFSAEPRNLLPSFTGLHSTPKHGCPILATSLFLWLGWDSTNP